MSNIWDERYKTGEGLRFWPNEELVRFLGRTYGDPRTTPCHAQMAIDLGCGTGCNMLALNQWGFFPYGYDSEAAVAVARAYLQSMVFTAGLNRYELGQLTLPAHLPCTNDTADLVVDCQTIQHLSWPHRADTYKEVTRILKPGGKFWSMIWSGNAEAAHVIYAGCYPVLDFVTADEWMTVLAENGLRAPRPYRIIRSYPEHNFVEGEWLVIEAVKP